MADEREQAEPDVDNLPQYIHNRTRVLHRTYEDHMAWDKRLRASSMGKDIAVTWFDHEGQKHTAIISRAYMAIHWKIMRSIILDLADCGNEGLDVLRAIVKRSEWEA